LKAAQDKEELQRRGDQLDADIRKAEKETRALENTVRLLGSRNQTYHRSLARVADNSKRYTVCGRNMITLLSMPPPRRRDRGDCVFGLVFVLLLLLMSKRSA